MLKALRVSMLILTVALGAVFASGAVGAAAADPDITGHVYVNNNAAPTNSISGFNRHSDGRITPMPGNAFQTGGAGTGAPLGSQGSLQMTDDGRFILAVNTASNSISVLAVQDDGSLSLVGSPENSGGKTPVSIAVHGSLVYVANAGAGGSNYTGFRLDANGRLTPIAGSTYSLPDIANPGDVLFNSTGSILVGVRVGPNAGPSFIDSFAVNANRTLTPAPTSPYQSPQIGPFGSEFSPVNPNLLFVSNAHDGPGKGSVSVYNVAADGRLTAVPGSPFADQGTGACWLEISHDGKFVYVVNTGTPSVSSYSVAADGKLTFIGSTVFHRPNGLSPFDARLDPTGKFLYVVDSGAARVSTFAVNGGTLTEIGVTPVYSPAGGAPFGLVVN